MLVYGDTNSTLAGALAAAKLHVPVAHVEAGLRSFNRAMPEEINRVVTDQLSTCCSARATRRRANLAREGITSGVHVVGDVMAEALAHVRAVAERRRRSAARTASRRASTSLATVHRAENTDDPERLARILEALRARSMSRSSFPAHPRTRAAIAAARMPLASERPTASRRSATSR